MRSRRRSKRKATGNIVLLCMLILLCLAVYKGYELFSESNGLESTGNKISQEKSKTKEWNLIMVNKKNPVPKDYSIDFTELAVGERVDSRIYPSLQEMFDDARNSGVFPVVRAGYRSYDEQKKLYDEKINDYVNEGHSKSQAKKLAKEWVAFPGTSEHQLGIAVDINADQSRSSSDEVYGWLKENAHKYGFILRYPPDKSDITGIQYEPWHYRYVGTEAAEIIYSKGICLEEYLK